MKAAAQDQWKLLDLAQTDRRIAQAEHRRRTLPELAELKDLAVQRRTLAEEVVAKSTALSDAKMEQERIEGDLEPARARMERNQKTVDAGTITDHKALRGLTEEIEHLGRRISRLEDADAEEEADESLGAPAHPASMMTGSIETATARRRNFGVAGMAKLAFCDRRARPGNNRASSGGLRARLRLRSRRLPSAHGASGSSRGGSVIPLRVSSGFSPDSSAGVVTSNLTRGF